MSIDPSWTVLAWEELSSNPFDSLHPAQLPTQLVNNGWKFYLQSRLQQALVCGYDGHVWHRPHGQHDYLKDMNFGALKRCQKDARLSKVADVNAFVDAFAWWFEQTGKKPQWFYYGCFPIALDPWKGTTPEVRTALMQECLFPLHKLKQAIGGNATGPMVHLIIDTLGDKALKTLTGGQLGGGGVTETLTDFGIAVDLATQWGIPVHAEPRLATFSPLLKTASWAFTAEHEDRKADTQSWAAKRSAYGPGQKICPWMTRDPLIQAETEAQAFDRAAAALKRCGAVAVPMYHGWSGSAVKQKAGQLP